MLIVISPAKTLDYETAPVTDYTCRGCGSGKYERVFEAREMMFGMRTAFTYSICGACGSAQVEDPDILAHLAEYYPENYYSHETTGGNGLLKRAAQS